MRLKELSFWILLRYFSSVGLGRQTGRENIKPTPVRESVSLCLTVGQHCFRKIEKGQRCLYSRKTRERPSLFPLKNANGISDAWVVVNNDLE